MMFNNVKIENVVKVYNGAPGCGCGCKGKYSTTPRSKQMQLKKFQSFIGPLQPTTVHDDMVCFAIETDTRYHWLYVKN